MKITFKISFVLIVFLSSVVRLVNSQDFRMTDCQPGQWSDSTGNKELKIREALDQLVGKNIPGAVAAIAEGDNYWSYAAGLAKIESGSPMGTCHLQYLQSISKTYMAVVIMKLYEEGKIQLEAPISQYLPDDLTVNIQGIERISITMLLNHTSGLPEYNYAPAYITRLLQQPYRIFHPYEYIEYIENSELDFEPGSTYAYRNVNYLMLAIIADKITGDHARYMKERIFLPVELNDTYYRIGQFETYDNRLVNSYWDRHSDGIIENITMLQRSNVASMVGDDGIVTTPADAIRFLKALMEGKIVSSSTLKKIQEWTFNKDGNPEYGLGLDYTEIAGLPAIGHSGGGLGAGCQLYFFPSKNLYMFLAINLGTVTTSPIHAEAEKILNVIHAAIVN